MELWQALLLAIAGVAVGFGIGYVLGGNSILARLRLSRDDAQRLQTDAALAEQVQKVLHPPPPPPGPVKPSGVPVRVLALLQRAGRFVDFVLEDFQAAND